MLICCAQYFRGQSFAPTSPPKPKHQERQGKADVLPDRWRVRAGANPAVGTHVFIFDNFNLIFFCAVWSVRIIRLFSATLYLAARMSGMGSYITLRANLGSTPRVAASFYLFYVA